MCIFVNIGAVGSFSRAGSSKTLSSQRTRCFPLVFLHQLVARVESTAWTECAEQRSDTAPRERTDVLELGFNLLGFMACQLLEIHVVRHPFKSKQRVDICRHLHLRRTGTSSAAVDRRKTSDGARSAVEVPSGTKSRATSCANCATSATSEAVTEDRLRTHTSLELSASELAQARAAKTQRQKCLEVSCIL